MTWRYNNRSIESIDDMPEGTIGFVYKIMDIKTGRFYIGKKVTHHTRKVRIGKREKERTKTRKTFKRVTKESNWLTYTGSCKELNEDIKKLGDQRFIKIIIEFCCSKKYMNYAEVKHQIQMDVLTADSYNGNILGKYYRKDMQNC